MTHLHSKIICGTKGIKLGQGEKGVLGYLLMLWNMTPLPPVTSHTKEEIWIICTWEGWLELGLSVCCQSKNNSLKHISSGCVCTYWWLLEAGGCISNIKLWPKLGALINSETSCQPRWVCKYGTGHRLWGAAFHLIKGTERKPVFEGWFSDSKHFCRIQWLFVSTVFCGPGEVVHLVRCFPLTVWRPESAPTEKVGSRDRWLPRDRWPAGLAESVSPGSAEASFSKVRKRKTCLSLGFY